MIGEGSLVRAYLLIVFTIGLSRIVTALDTYNRSLYIFNLILHVAETIFFISESAFNGTISWDMIEGLMRIDPTVISENGGLFSLFFPSLFFITLTLLISLGKKIHWLCSVSSHSIVCG